MLKYVLRGIARRLCRVHSALDGPISRACSRHPFLSSLYYCFWNSSFYREHHAVLLAKREYHIVQTSPQGTSTLIRRNVHRLEKGLIMKPRRDVFAVDYIEETVSCFLRATNDETCSLAAAELRWATDVLSRYFEATGSHPTIDSQRKRFRDAPSIEHKHVPNRHTECAPYLRDTEEQPVTHADMLRLAMKRRSVRWFLPTPVDRRLLEQALDIAAQSPSACNRQPFEFRVFDDPEAITRVAALPPGSRGFAHNFPVIIVVIGRLESYFSERDRHVIYIDAALASMALLFGLESVGLASCCINWPDIQERELAASRTLGLRPYERPIMFIAAGHPDPEGMVPYSEKKPVKQLCRYNHE